LEDFTYFGKRVFVSVAQLTPGQWDWAYAIGGGEAVENSVETTPSHEAALRKAQEHAQARIRADQGVDDVGTTHGGEPRVRRKKGTAE
jgi:hypothetical protein